MHEIDSPSWFNPVEGSKIVDLIEGLLNSSTVDVSADDIGVIAFYRQQVLKIRLMLRERNLSQVRVGGVNDYQGQEARIIFISTVVAKQRQFDPAVDPIGTCTIRGEQRKSASTAASCDITRRASRSAHAPASWNLPRVNCYKWTPLSVCAGGKGGASETAKKFNVALTRGKALNVVVGNPFILEADPCWRCVSGTPTSTTNHVLSHAAMD